MGDPYRSNPAPAVRTIAALIEEVGDGWRLTTATGLDETHPSAVDAQSAVAEMGRILADGGASNAIVITWAPVTVIGRAVLRAIGVAR